ncbi:hypothetical protein V8C86DRAFT_2862126 [Haematococcus lacustris]
MSSSAAAPAATAPVLGRLRFPALLMPPCWASARSGAGSIFNLPRPRPTAGLAAACCTVAAVAADASSSMFMPRLSSAARCWSPLPCGEETAGTSAAGAAGSSHRPCAAPDAPLLLLGLLALHSASSAVGDDWMAAFLGGAAGLVGKVSAVVPAVGLNMLPGIATSFSSAAAAGASACNSLLSFAAAALAEGLALACLPRFRAGSGLSAIF